MRTGMFLALLLWGGIALFVVGDDEFSTFTLHDNQTELTNPDMGFNHYQYDDGLDVYGSRLLPEDTLSDWPGMSSIYIRIPWSLVEPEEGKFCWYIIDDQLRKFNADGTKIGLRFTVTESFIQDATPLWVQKSGAKGARFTHGVGISNDGERWEPHYGDPIFLEKLENFLKAAAERYNNPDEVSFVDVGTFGIWGEGHTWLGTSLPFSDEIVKKHIDLHLKYFDKVPVLGVSGFFERAGVARPVRKGVYPTNYVFSISPQLNGKRFEVRVHLNNAYTGNLEPQFAKSDDNTCSIGYLRFDEHGVPSFEANEAAVLPEKLTKPYAVKFDRLEYDPKFLKYSGKIHVTFIFAEEQPAHVKTEIYFHNDKTGQFYSNAKEERFGGELLDYMVAKNMGYRDDSVIVTPLTAAIQGAYVMDKFWRKQPIVLELAHHDHILNNKGWFEGEDMIRAIEDCHASIVSIHTWPREFLQDNRELIRRANLVIGYRYNLNMVKVKLQVPGSLKGTLNWKNVGVAPSYKPLYPTLTLKNDNGGICGSFTLDQARLDQIMPGETAQFNFDFMIPKILYSKYKELLKGQEFNLYISAGSITGKPAIHLPLDNHDGEKRYKIGRIKVQ